MERGASEKYTKKESESEVKNGKYRRLGWKGTSGLVKAPERSMNWTRLGKAYLGSPKSVV